MQWLCVANQRSPPGKGCRAGRTERAPTSPRLPGRRPPCKHSITTRQKPRWDAPCSRADRGVKPCDCPGNCSATKRAWQIIARSQRGGKGVPVLLHCASICSTASVSVERSRRVAPASRRQEDGRLGQKSSAKRQGADREAARGGMGRDHWGILLGVSYTPPGRPSRPAPKRQQPPPNNRGLPDKQGTRCAADMSRALLADGFPTLSRRWLLAVLAQNVHRMPQPHLLPEARVWGSMARQTFCTSSGHAV